MRALRMAALLLCVVATTTASASATPESRYAEAAQLYEQQRYPEAAQAFKDWLREEGAHPSALLGLGNAAYRSGDWVSATYAYEWGHRLAPGDEALAENLGLARAHLVADVFPTDEAESARQARAWLARIPARLSLPLGLAAWTLGFVLLALRQRGRLPGWTWLAAALILLSLPAFAHAAWQWRRHGGAVEGILQGTEVDVRSGPAPEYQQLFELHAGTVVRVLEERPGWRRVQLPNQAEGWVEAADLAVFGDVETLAPRP